jgi:hypothetical protein
MHSRRTLELTVGLLVFLAILAFSAYVFVRALSFGTPSAIVTAALTLGSALIVQTATNAFQRKREVEADQRREKAKVYQSFMDLWFDDMVLPGILEKQRSRRENPVSGELITKMGNFTKQVILWGSDDVLREYSRYRAVAIGQTMVRPKPLDPKLAGLERLFLPSGVI